jgi:TusA-related sulfurtransferase/DNA-binding transcriptional regulator YhcF (GntR family)
VKILNIKDFFKALSNQTRLEILLMILDNYLTASEIAEKLNMDVSTVYRHLKYLKNLGILKSKRVKGVELFDFVSIKVFNVVENAIEFVSEVNGTRIFNSNTYKKCLFEAKSDIEPHIIVDMRGEVCPVPDIQTKNFLSSMKKGEILLVIVDYPLSAERIPISVKSIGGKVIKIVSNRNGEYEIYILKNQ